MDSESTSDPLGTALAAYAAEYADLTDSWRQLDAKAQGSGALAGVFIAAIYALVRDLQNGASSPWLRAGLIIAIVLFLVTVTLSVWALRVRAVQAPPLGETMREIAEDLMTVPPEDRTARMPDFTRDHIRLWRDTNADLRKQTEQKATQVRRAQAFLLAAIIVVGVETIVLITGVV